VGRLVVLVALVAVAGGVGRSSGATPADPYASFLATASACPGRDRADLAPSRAARALGCLVDHARRVRGLAALRRSRELGRAAALVLAEESRCRKRASHDPCGQGWLSVFRRAGYPLGGGASVAENLGYAQDTLAAPSAVMDMWLHSTVHRRNLLGAGYREGGFAVLPVDGGVLYAATFGARPGS
jgi:uncharacterized protein YkwD